MASMAEQSVASISSTQLQQCREQLLNMHHPGGATQAELLSRQQHSQRSTSEQDDVPLQDLDGESIGDVDSLGTFRTPARRLSRPPHATARPEYSKSAPVPQRAGTMASTTQPQDAVPAAVKAATFAGRAFGDTQPMESQVYREYSESIYRPDVTTPLHHGASARFEQHTYETVESGTTQRTMHTLKQGDTGYVDLGAAFGQQAEQPEHPSSSQANFDDLLNEETSPQTQFPAPAVPARASMPETPAVAGRKHGRDGELLLTSTGSNTARKTPGFSQFFGLPQAGPLLTASQLFDQTQAPSSPMLDALRSDPIVTRPSPNVNEATSGLITSPPPIAFSSPIAARNARPSTANGEPRQNYTPMLASQERKAAKSRDELGLGNDSEQAGEEEDDDDIFGLGPLRIADNRLRRAASAQVGQSRHRRHEMSRAGALFSSTKKAHSMIDLVTPATVRRGERINFDDEEDGELSVDFDGEEAMEEDAEDPVAEEAEFESKGDGHLNITEQDEDLDAQNDDDEYDELGQTVLRSQSNVQEDEDNEREEAVHDEDGEHEPDTMVQPPVDENLPEAGQLMSTQRSAIADSQPLPGRASQQRAQRAFAQPAPMSSFVPGSQYAGKTSEDQVRNRNGRNANDSASGERLPSSPPLLQVEPEGGSASTPSAISAQSSSKHTKLVKQAQSAPVGMPEILESEYTDHDAAAPQSASAAAGTIQEASNSGALFSTARTHVSSSGPSPAVTSVPKSPARAIASQLSRASQFSPRKAAGIRPFAETANDIVPDESSGNTQTDISNVMNAVMTVDDHDYVAAVSNSPVRKRATRERVQTQVPEHLGRSVEEPGSSFLAERRVVLAREEAPVAHGTRPELNITQTEFTDDSSPPRPMKRRRAVQPRLPPSSISERPEGTAPSDEQNNDPPDVPQPLVESPSKANEMPDHAMTDMDELAAPETDAVKPDQLTSSRPTREGKLPKRAKGAIKTPRGIKPLRKKSPTPAEIVDTEADPSTLTPNETSMELDTKPEKPVAPLVAADAKDIPEPPEVSTTAQDDSTSKIAPHEGPLAPRRVLALFKGAPNNFFPATWVANSTEGHMYQVRFDDGTVACLDVKQVCSLELRPGDLVKVDTEGMRKPTWEIVALIAADEPTSDFAGDAAGNTFLQVRVKSSRKSVSNADIQDQVQTHKVPIASIYLTHTMWTPFQSRGFHPPVVANGPLRSITPSTATHDLKVETPGKRGARARVASIKGIAEKSIPLLRETSSAFTSKLLSGSIFSGMAFAISYVSSNAEKHAEKAEVTRLIELNGGKILEDGFEELFLLPDMNEQKAAERDGGDGTDRGLRLKPEYADLGFTAVIADGHSRRAKYMQALALGLPTLSGRWVLDSLNLAKNSTLGGDQARPLSWERYLLPSGESTFLGGAVRSRMLTPYGPIAESAKIQARLSTRPALLQHEGVLMIAPKKGSAGWEKRRTYVFLTLALGAGRVHRVANVQEASDIIAADPATWKWVYVDSSVTEAASALFGKKPAGGKKRKRANEGQSHTTNSMSATDGQVKLVNDEFVVQSLILGALIE